ncbi:MAG: hypothetical protein IKO44_02765 [Ruminococcus sp.]|nr:hypothetical protein [Ruminococcus sp.]
MKKFIIAMLAALTALFCLAGCGSEFVGEWECTKIKDNGETLKASEFKDYYDYDISEFVTLEFDKGGEGTFSYKDRDEKGSVDFEWEEDDDKVTIKLDKEFFGTKKLKGKLKDDELVLTGFNEDDFSVYLSKADED